MAEPLEYRRVVAREGERLSRAGVLARVMGVGAGVAFVAPFGLVRAAEGVGDPVARMMLMMGALVLWFAAGLMGLTGTIAGGVALYRERPRAWTIVAAAVNAVVLLIALMAAVGGIMRSVRGGG